MKFRLLAVGQQFEYQGETYIKSTPLIAHQVDTGEQRLIPFSATVVTAGTPAAPARSGRSSIGVAELQQALAEFEQALRESLEGDERFVRALEQARRQLFQRLKITPVAPRADDHSSS